MGQQQGVLLKLKGARLGPSGGKNLEHVNNTQTILIESGNARRQTSHQPYVTNLANDPVLHQYYEGYSCRLHWSVGAQDMPNHYLTHHHSSDQVLQRTILDLYPIFHSASSSIFATLSPTTNLTCFHKSRLQLRLIRFLSGATKKCLNIYEIRIISWVQLRHLGLATPSHSRAAWALEILLQFDAPYARKSSPSSGRR